MNSLEILKKAVGRQRRINEANNEDLTTLFDRTANTKIMIETQGANLCITNDAVDTLNRKFEELTASLHELKKQTRKTRLKGIRKISHRETLRSDTRTEKHPTYITNTGTQTNEYVYLGHAYSEQQQSNLTERYQETIKKLSEIQQSAQDKTSEFLNMIEDTRGVIETNKATALQAAKDIITMREEIKIDAIQQKTIQTIRTKLELDTKRRIDELETRILQDYVRTTHDMTGLHRKHDEIAQKQTSLQIAVDNLLDIVIRKDRNDIFSHETDNEQIIEKRELDFSRTIPNEFRTIFVDNLETKAIYPGLTQTYTTIGKEKFWYFTLLQDPKRKKISPWADCDLLKESTITCNYIQVANIIMQELNDNNQDFSLNNTQENKTNNAILCVKKKALKRLIQTYLDHRDMITWSTKQE
jgi:hypothetical protein